MQEKKKQPSIFRHLKKYWWCCILAPLFMVGEISVDLIQPDLMAEIIDDGVLKGNLSFVTTTGLRMIVLVVLGGACGILCGVFANIASQSFGNDVRKDLFRHIESLSFSQTDAFSTGSLITRLVSDVTQIQILVMTAMRGLIRSGIMFAGGIYMLSRQSTAFAGIALKALPVVAGIIVFFLFTASPMFTKVQEKLDAVNSALQENLAGARVVKAFVREEAEEKRFNKANEDLCRTTLRVNELIAFLSPLTNIVLNLCVAAVLRAAGTMDIESGQVIASITYMTMILNAVTFLANIFQELARSAASLRRVQEVMATPIEITAPENPAHPDHLGTVCFDHVSFTYPGTPRPVLSDLSFSIGRGQTLGIIGETGCGKTSLVRLIPRFYDASEGSVKVDGVDVREFDPKDLHKRIAYVFQKAELYTGSVRDNIVFGNPDVTKKDVLLAAKTAQADGFIREMGEGYDTPVTESGHSLSGGQKQRVAIARALARNAEILILDDATSALDLATEHSLYEALSASYPGITRIIVAQRINSIRNADQILVLDHGKAVDLGTHEELVSRCAIYRDICESQLGKEALR